MLIKLNGFLKWNLPKNQFSHQRFTITWPLYKQFRCIFTRESNSTNSTYHLTQLTNRKVIKVTGSDAFSYIQLITTNNLQQNRNCLNSYLISSQGHILSDLLIYKIKGDVFDKELVLNGLTGNCYGKRFADCLKETKNLNESNQNLIEELDRYTHAEDEDVLYLECDARLADSVRKTLFAHRIKQNVNFELVDDLRVYSAFQPISELEEKFILNDEFISNYFCLVNDPRLPYLGQRIITKLPENLLTKFMKAYSFKNFTIESKPLRDYRLHRYLLGVGEGFKEHWVNQVYVNSFNGDLLNGIDLYKGAFNGRKLIKRTIDKKFKYMTRLLPFKIINQTDEKIDNLPQRVNFFTLKNENPVGELIRNVGNHGIGYFKLTMFVHFNSNRSVQLKLFHNEKEYLADVRIPSWWPDIQKIQYLEYEEDLEHFRQRLLDQENNANKNPQLAEM